MIQPVIPSLFALPSDLHDVQPSAEQKLSLVPIPPSESAHRSGTATSHTSHNAMHGHDNTSLEKTLEQLNLSMQAWATGMRFDVDEDAQRVVVSIIDSQTGEVLRTVPSESVIRIARMIVQLQGTTINTQA